MADSNTEIDTKYCSTCKQDVPSANFEMHVIHCARFLTPCPQCGESVNKRQLQEHIDENHVEVRCDACKTNVEKMELEDHKISSCPSRNVNCSYCEITLPACDIEEHREACGSRTEECDSCQRRILVKDLESHIASGCQTPVKKNIDQSSQSKQPERLVGGGLDFPRNRMFNNGFPIHSQFNPPSLYDNEKVVNPYLPSSQYKPFDHVKHESPKVSTTTQRKKTPSKPAGIETAKNSSPLAKNKSQVVSGGQGALNFKSRGGVGTENDRLHNSKSDVKNASSWNCQRKTYGYQSSDSDSDDHHNYEEKSAAPDLTDETMLPCEFCSEMLPADSLGFHQANCDSVPPTPRPRSPPKMKRTSREIFPSRNAQDFQSPFFRSEAAAFPHDEFPFRNKSPDIGEGSAPCEFCLESFPLVGLALHQVTCQQNPNLHDSGTSEQSRPSPLPANGRPRDLPKSNPSGLPKSHPLNNDTVYSEPLRRNPPSFDKQAKPANSSPNTKAREKRSLAPMFTRNVSESPDVIPATQPTIQPPSTVSANPPKNQSSLNNNSPVERKAVRKHKRKPIPKKAPANSPQKFHEVNVLGGNDMLGHSRNDFNNSFASDRSLGFNPNLSNGGQYPLSRTANDHAANIRNFHQRNALPKNHTTNSLRNPRGEQNPARGQNASRGQNATRGRSFGSSTVTIRPRRGHNPRQGSGIETSQRDVSSQPDLTLQGQPVRNVRNDGVSRRNFASMPGEGQRLGSSPGLTRTLHPPRNNTYE